MIADPVQAAADTLRRSAAAFGCPIEIVTGEAVDWWSATFQGHRVTLTLAAAPSAMLVDWIAALPDIELPIRGRFVADCVVDGGIGDGRMTVALLLIDAT